MTTIKSKELISMLIDKELKTQTHFHNIEHK